MNRTVNLLFIALLIATSNVNAQSIPKDGLIAWYSFDGNTDDGSGNGMHGNSKNIKYVPNRYGKQKSAIYFSGENSFIEIPGFEILNSLPLTISCWFNFNSDKQLTDNGDGGIVSKYVAASWNGWAVTVNSSESGTLSPWYIRDYNNNVIGGYGNQDFKTSNIGNSRWHNQVFVIDYNGGKLYIDGELVSYTSWKGVPGSTLSSSGSMYLGLYPPTYFYRGLIDDLAIWNKALTESEIKAIYGNFKKSTTYLSSLVNKNIYPSTTSSANQPQNNSNSNELAQALAMYEMKKAMKEFSNESKADKSNAYQCSCCGKTSPKSQAYKFDRNGNAVAVPYSSFGEVGKPIYYHTKECARNAYLKKCR